MSKFYTHYITHTADVNALLDEVGAKYPQYIKTDEETGKRTIEGFPKARAIHNPAAPDETVCICRGLPPEAADITSLIILGQWTSSNLAGAPDENAQQWFIDNNVFVDEAARLKYEAVTGNPSFVAGDDGVDREDPYINGIA